MLCVVAPKSICGSGDRARNKAWASARAVLFSGAPEYVQQGQPGSTTPSPRYPTVGEEGEENYRRQDSKGLLRRSPGHSVNGSSLAAKENGEGVGGRRENWEGIQAAATSGYVATSVFRLLKKNPPTPHHAPATVCLTQSSRTLKKTQSASSSFWGRGWVMGVSVSLEAGAGRGQTDKVSLRTRKPLASLRSSRASEGIQVSRGSAGASTQSVRKACRVCRPWRRWRWPCR